MVKGIVLFIRNDIPAKVVSTDDKPIASFYVELNFRNKKWLLNCSFSFKHISIESHLGLSFQEYRFTII